MKELILLGSFVQYLVKLFPDIAEEIKAAVKEWSSSPEGQSALLNVIKEDNHKHIDQTIDTMIQEMF